MRLFLIAMALIGGLSACGHGTDLTNRPQCKDIWVEGATLPELYDGCYHGDTLEVMVYNGAGQVVYQDRLEAHVGGKIEAVK